jgi:putative SOS response-associated peptidase YedK
LESYTIVTTEAAGDMVRLHERQTVILPREQWDVWLDPDLQEPEAVQKMIRPWSDRFVFDSVDPCINNSRNEGADYFKPGTNTLCPYQLTPYER